MPERASGAPRFQAGDPVRPGRLYVERSTDERLFEDMIDGRLCVVTAPRQMGKTSLANRVANRLKMERGWMTLYVSTEDVDCSGHDESVFLEGLIAALEGGLSEQGVIGSQAPLVPERAPSRLTALSTYLEQTTRRLSAHTAVFIDEIDGLLRVASRTGHPDFPEEFLRKLRGYQTRHAGQDHAHFVFCLLGVLTPAELMGDTTLTSLNGAAEILLDDFRRDELVAFEQALVPTWGDEARAVVDDVHAWASGQPFHTQRICERLANRRQAPQERGPTTELVAGVVDSLFFDPRHPDANLKKVESHFVDMARRMPGLRQEYRRLIEGGSLAIEAETPLAQALRIVGIASIRAHVDGNLLVPRSRIFARHFDGRWLNSLDIDHPFYLELTRWTASGRRDEDLLAGWRLDQATVWIKDQGAPLSGDEQQFYSRSMQQADRLRRRQVRWLALGGLGAIGLVVVLALLLRENLDLTRQLRGKVTEAEEAASEARTQQEAAEIQKDKAESAEQEARQSKVEAERSATIADRLRSLAESATRRAIEESRRALLLMDEAESARSREEDARAQAEVSARQAEAEKERVKDAQSREKGFMAKTVARNQDQWAMALRAALEATDRREEASGALFPSVRGGLISALEAANGTLIRLPSGVDAHYPVRFAADGTRLAFALFGGAPQTQGIFVGDVGPSGWTRYVLDQTWISFDLGPDGRRLATLSPSGSVSVHLLESSGAPTSSAPAAGLREVLFSPRGDLVAVWGEGGVRVLDAATGETVARGGPGPVSSVAWDRSGRRLLFSQRGVGVSLLDFMDGHDEARLLWASRHPIEQLVLEEGPLLGDPPRAVLARDERGLVTVIPWSPGDSPIVSALEGVFELMASADGGRVPLLFRRISSGKTLGLTLDGQLVWALDAPGSVDRPWDLDLEVSSNGGRVLLRRRFDVAIWELGTSTPFATSTGTAGYDHRLSPDGSWVALFDRQDGEALLAPILHGLTRLTLPTQGAVVTALSVSPDGRALAASDTAGRVHVWDLRAGEVLAAVPWPAEQAVAPLLAGARVSVRAAPAIGWCQGDLLLGDGSGLGLLTLGDSSSQTDLDSAARTLPSVRFDAGRVRLQPEFRGPVRLLPDPRAGFLAAVLGDQAGGVALLQEPSTAAASRLLNVAAKDAGWTRDALVVLDQDGTLRAYDRVNERDIDPRGRVLASGAHQMIVSPDADRVAMLAEATPGGLADAVVFGGPRLSQTTSVPLAGWRDGSSQDEAEHRGQVPAAPLRLAWSDRTDLLLRVQEDGSYGILQSLRDGVTWPVSPPDEDRYTAFAFAPDGRMLALGTAQGRVQILQAPDWEVGDVVLQLPREGGSITALAWTPRGRDLAVARDRFSVDVLSLDDATLIHRACSWIAPQYGRMPTELETLCASR